MTPDNKATTKKIATTTIKATNAELRRLLPFPFMMMPFELFIGVDEQILFSGFPIQVSFTFINKSGKQSSGKVCGELVGDPLYSSGNVPCIPLATKDGDIVIGSLTLSSSRQAKDAQIHLWYTPTHSGTVAAEDTTSVNIRPNFQIPLIVVLWEHVNYGGKKRVILGTLRTQIFYLPTGEIIRFPLTGIEQDIGSKADLGDTKFKHAHGISIYEGPNFDDWMQLHRSEPTVSFYREDNFQGKCLTLGVGGYPNVDPLDFGGHISSIRFYTGKPIGLVDAVSGAVFKIDPQPIAPRTLPIPLIITLFDDKLEVYVDANNTRIDITDSADDLSAEYGDPSVSAIVVQKGPDYRGTETASFYKRDGTLCVSNLGPNAEGNPEIIPDLSKIKGCNDEINRVKINY